MMLQYYIDNNLCKAGSIDSELDWLIINNLGKPVNDDKDGVICFAIQVSGYW